MDHRKLQQQAEDGEIAPLKAYLQLRKDIDDRMKSLEILKDLSTTEFYQVYGGKDVTIYGATVTKHQGGRYDYKHIPRWVAAKSKLDAIEDEAQQAYKAATDKMGGQMMDEETGEIIEPAVYKANKESFAVKFN